MTKEKLPYICPKCGAEFSTPARGTYMPPLLRAEDSTAVFTRAVCPTCGTHKIIEREDICEVCGDQVKVLDGVYLHKDSETRFMCLYCYDDLAEQREDV